MNRRAALARLSVLMATAFVEMVGFLVVLPLLPFYATRLGGDAIAVGLMAGVRPARRHHVRRARSSLGSRPLS